MQLLPVGIQSFANLRNGGYLYVDKTKEIHRLITSGRIYFLSRPRRFGKSLLVSTLEELFSGNKSLFEGLYIYDKMDWSQQYPVITIDWSVVKHSTAEEMERDTCTFLAGIAASHQITLKSEYASSRLNELIVRLYKKNGRQVVVLVDEYDMPILDALDNSKEFDSIRYFMQAFYKVLKGADKYLRFVFLTGVSKIAKVAIFSGMNSPDDITMDAQYATICGYTQDELENNFEEYINDFALAQQMKTGEIIESIRRWFNGYSWDGHTTVYNPFSTLLLFRKRVFANYWFASGTPTFLVDQIKKNNDVKFLIEPSELFSSEFDSYKPDAFETKLLLFQTGYLTVKNVTKSRFGEQMKYTLGVPNNEVRQSMMEHLVSSYAEYPVSETATKRDRMLNQLFDGDVSSFRRDLQEMFAHIPYQLHIPCESYYHSLFLVWLNMLGFEVNGEVSTDKGRIDAVWTWEERVVVTEIKYADKGSIKLLLQEAFEQIYDRRYYERYLGNNRRVALLAIAFAGKEIACRMEEI